MLHKLTMFRTRCVWSCHGNKYNCRYFYREGFVLKTLFFYLSHAKMHILFHVMNHMVICLRPSCFSVFVGDDPEISTPHKCLQLQRVLCHVEQGGKSCVSNFFIIGSLLTFHCGG